MAGGWSYLTEPRKLLRDLFSQPTGSWGDPLQVQHTISVKWLGQLATALENRLHFIHEAVAQCAPSPILMMLPFSRQKTSSSQGRLGHGGSEGRLHHALVDKASLRWRLHDHNCRVSWQVGAWSQPLNHYVRPLFEQVGGSARRQKLFEISWKCRVCRLLLWTCTTGTKYFRNSEKLMMG